MDRAPWGDSDRLRLRRRLSAWSSDRVALAVVALAGLALAARLAWLDHRLFHWDEARVGYDVLRYAATGEWEYRPLVHGPFLAQVNRLVFVALGATDATARLVVAVVGGLFPLAALLFRRHLNGTETVALAGLLAVEPALLYYSRFMRNDVLVAAFSVVALGALVRFADTRRRRYLHLAAVALALAFTTKANAALYVLAVGGAALLVADQRLLRGGAPLGPAVVGGVRALATGGRRYWRTLAAGAVEFLAVTVAFYAPRGDGLLHPTVSSALEEPSVAPAVVRAATVGAAGKLVGTWVGGGHQDHPYLPFLADYATTLGLVSGGLVALALFGALRERYGRGRPRALVELAFYWGAASVVGYPLATDIEAPWAVVHAVVPLAFPAAVGLAALFERWRAAARTRDLRSGALTLLLGTLLVGHPVGAAVATSYVAPQSPDNPLVQYAQPEGDLRPVLEDVEERVRGRDGVAVVWHGTHFFLNYEPLAEQLPVPTGGWYNRLPLPWYFERYGAEAASTRYEWRLARIVEQERPPVVVARASQRANVSGVLAGYRTETFTLRQRAVRVVVFLRAADEDDAWTQPGWRNASPRRQRL